MMWPFNRTVDPDKMPLPAPKSGPVWAIGDIHGCSEQLDALLLRIAQEGSDDALVLLGDYADRGPDSAGVYQRIRTLSDTAPSLVTCLMGNHDRMLLDFLADPIGAGPRFLGNGGQETLMSYGILPDRRGTVEDRLYNQGKAFAEAFGDMAEWLAARPLWHQDGNCIFVHAQTDPEHPMADQPEDILLWERPPPKIEPRRDGAWVIHGHTVMREPRIQGGHIAIDTGAFQGRALTAVRLAPGEEPRFIQV